MAKKLQLIILSLFFIISLIATGCLGKETITNSRIIPIIENNAQTELQCTLLEKKSKHTYIELKYYQDGEQVLFLIDAEMIPEINQLFLKGSSKDANQPGYNVDRAIYNRELSMVYLIVEESAETQGVETSIYTFNMKNTQVSLLYKATGIFTDLMFTRDNSLMAFSYNLKDTSSSFLQIIDTKTGGLIINQNKLASGELIGQSEKILDKSTVTLYSWISNTTAIVKLIIEDESTKAKEQSEFLYDTVQNKFLNRDGTEIIANVAESEPVKALKAFYDSAQVGNADNTFKFLTDDFKLKAFKQLGVKDMTRKEMGLSEFAIFSGMIKLSTIKSIPKVIIKDNNASIYIVQNLTTSMGDLELPLVVEMSETDTLWKLTAIIDGNINEEPFK
jgi:hypothetical protein